MLGTSMGAMALSQDQTPFSKVERDRIKKCGGRIMSADQVDGIVPFHENWDCKLGEELDDDGDPPRVWNQDLERVGPRFFLRLRRRPTFGPAAGTRGPRSRGRSGIRSPRRWA